MIPTIITERLSLRPPCMADAAPHIEVLQSDRAIHMGGPFSQEAAWLDFCAGVAGWHLRGYGMLSIDHRKADTFLGMVFMHRELGDPENELGWILVENAEGHGYAFEAGSAARDYAFATLGWETAVSYITPENARSVAVALKLGATLDPAAERPAGHPTCLVYRHPKPEALQ